MTITANDVKTKGVGLFTSLLETFDELIINVRGKNKFVVIEIERYNELRAMELDIAYIQTKEDLKSKKYKTQTAKEHLEELLNEL